MISISLNGELRQFSQPLSVAALVNELGLSGKRIALERNGEIVPRSLFDSQHIQDGDKLELVTAVGGG